MSVIDEIKDKLDLVDIVQERVQLQRAGKNWRGPCPFHNEKTPSFTVFPRTQTWKCFGGGCGKGGDLINFVQELNGWDFKETLRYLAERAGVELKPLNQEEQKQIDQKRERETILGAAMEFFQERLASDASGHEYALSRGWSQETIQDAGIGYFGKDWEALRAHLHSQGVDLEHPVAVALTGMRGDVGAWAKSRGVAISQTWINQGKVPAMPPEMLIYPHRWRGRVVYLAGRRLEGEVKSWNLPEELVGGKAPFFNHLWWEYSGDLRGRYYTIVEGQGDAVTLAQWSLPGVALAGSAIVRPENGNGRPSALIGELLRIAKAGGKIVLGLDNDPPGQKATPEAARALIAAGLSAVQLSVVTWPASDPNNWLIGKDCEEPWTPESAQILVSQAPRWIEVLIQMGKDDDRVQREVFQALARLDAYEVERWRPAVCEAYQLRARAFDAMIKAARRDAGLGEDGNACYLVMGGAMWHRAYDQYGEEKLVRLSHFEAHIAEDVLRDDGQDVRREIRVAGKVNGQPLPVARVDAGEFMAMNWVMREWGSKAIMEAGNRTKDHLRTAIQLLSKDIKRQTVYTHTGWRELPNGKRCFLSSTGAIGAPEVEVDLDRDLVRYALPLTPEDPKGAMELSLRFLDLAPDRVVYPIWGAVWLAPLRDLIDVGFMMWAYGVTGSLKSTLVALALNHYGPAFSERHMPADFVDTVNRLAHKAFVAKDALLVVDDFAPQSTRRSQDEYRAKAERLAREAGNQVGRGRMRSDGTAQATHIPRSLIIATGEDLAGVEGILSRMFIVEFKRDDVRKNLERLTSFQRKRHRLCHAMTGYLNWLMECWEGLKDTLPARREHYRLEALKTDMHLRFPEALASLAVGVEMGLRYALFLEVISPDDFQTLLEMGWNALKECVANMAEVTKHEKPQELFAVAVGTLITEGAIFLKERSGPGLLGGQDPERAKFVGWYDDECLHFLPGSVFTQVYQYYRGQGLIFPQTETMLRKTLKESGFLITEKDRLDRQVQVEGEGGKEKPRVMSVRRDLIPMEVKEVKPFSSPQGGMDL